MAILRRNLCWNLYGVMIVNEVQSGGVFLIGLSNSSQPPITGSILRGPSPNSTLFFPILLLKGQHVAYNVHQNINSCCFTYKPIHWWCELTVTCQDTPRFCFPASTCLNAPENQQFYHIMSLGWHMSSILLWVLRMPIDSAVTNAICVRCTSQHMCYTLRHCLSS